MLCRELVSRLNAMIEEGRLRSEDIPDDFEWLKSQLKRLSAPKDAADEAAIARAEDDYCNDDIEIDPDCFLSHADDGTWVGAWVWVAKEHEEESYAA